ncbi:MAG: phosphoenolpyruvate protein kinase, partial [Candidatus Bathyarchaeota archaeon]
YIVFREDQRFNLDRWITMNRRIYLDVGGILREYEILKEASDVFFLRREEIRRISEVGLTGEELGELCQLIKARKAEFLRYEHATPPKFLQGAREFNDPSPEEREALEGIPASQGVITAQVRVLSHIDDIWRVRAGEILVVPRTDPGWTPVFTKIGGLITETGGILNHGAVVSREYGIPVVANIYNACRVLRTGQRVTVDGNRGVVSIEE